MSNMQSGNLYIGLFHSKQQDEDATRANLINGLKNLLRSEHSDSLRIGDNADWKELDDDDWDNILNEILDTILPDDADRILYLSNCSSRKKDYCGITDCPLGSLSNCVLSDNDCSMMMVRPKCDTPSIDEMFPQNEVLALKCFVTFCPYKDNGCSLSVRDFTWAPKSDCRPFEVEANAHIHWDSTKPWEARPANILVTLLFQNLPAMSLKTAERLTDWRDYLDWRTRLINTNKRGIRYIGYKLLPEAGNVMFYVVAESQEEFRRGSFWRNNAIYTYPLSNSDNPWKFHEIEERKNRKWGKPLGDFIREEKNIIQPEMTDCPWQTPYVTGLVFELPDELQSDFQDYKEANGEEADLQGWLEREVTFQAQGFLSISAVGDENLLQRLKKTLINFATEGSVAAPFLSSYLFDISQARLPKKHFPIKEWQNPNMNEAQKQAVQMMIDAPDIAMIQGPPGTGKTTVIAEAIYQFVKQGKKVLLASQSNAAVINALERLADLPEIRPINLRKMSKDDSRQDDNQYSEKNILEDFYGNLGDKVKKILEKWKQNAEDLENVTRYKERLDVIHERLIDEQEFIDNVTKQIALKHADLNKARESLEKNNILLTQRKAGNAFITYLLSSEALQTLDCNFENVPDEIIEVAETHLLPIVCNLVKKGVRLLPEKYDKEASNDIRCGWLKLIFDKITALFNSQIAQLSKDLERLQGMTGDKVTSSENSLKIAELDQQLSLLEKEMNKAEDNNDDELYDELRRKRKGLRKEKEGLEASGSLPKEAYEAIFNSKDENGENWAEYIASPVRKRQELVDILSEFTSFFQQILGTYVEARSNIKANGESFFSSIKIDEQAQRTLTRAKVEYDKEVAARGDAERRRKDFMNSATELLQEMMQSIGMPENVAQSVETAINWCEQAIQALKKIEKDNEAEKRISPVYEKWLSFLEHPNDSDKDQVLDTYLENCSVVGLTCSADPKLLTERGYDHFEVVIIDEVSKTTPPELLLSMVMAEKTILVGDHRQLPPLFGDREPLAFEEIVQRDSEDESIPEEQKITEENFRKYKKMVVASLFKEHFENAPDALKSMLWIQYRMHPDIMNVINEFYENRLECGLGNPDLERDHSISSKDVNFIQDHGHAYWIDSTHAPDGKFWGEDKSGFSFENYLEAILIFETLVQLDKALDGKKKNNKPIKKSVGIIAFYGRQAGLLKKMKKRYKFTNFNPRIETVDRFQGQERDYILVSMTRNPQQHKIGRRQNSFMAQFERINVAFSRARELLLIYGARDMCDQYEISLPPLMGGTKTTKTKIYHRIIDSLDRKGCLVHPSQIISRESWETLKMQYKPPKGSIENANIRFDERPPRVQNNKYGTPNRNTGYRNNWR